jgi:hypothetical protein
MGLTVDTAPATARLFLIMRKPGGAPTQAEVLADASTLPLFSEYNLDYRDTYSIIKDEVVILTTNNPSKYIKWEVPLNNKLRFSGTTASYSNSTENTFTLGVFSDRATNGPSILAESTLYFVDN